MIETVDERSPGIVLWDEHDYTLELLDVDVRAREPAVLGQAYGLAATVYENACCFHDTPPMTHG